MDFHPPSSEHPPRFTLVLWQLGRLSADEVGRLEAHVDSCAGCREELEVLQRNVATVSETLPDRQNALAAELRRALARDQALSAGRGSWRFRLVWVTAAVAAAVAALWLILGPIGGLPDGRHAPQAPQRGIAPDVSYKGSALSLQVIASRDDQQRTLSGDVATVFARDRLRVVVTTGRPGHLALLSFDDRGQGARLQPPPTGADDPPLHLSRAGAHPLPGAFGFAEGSRREWLVAVFSPRPFSCARAREVLQQGQLWLADSPRGRPPSAALEGLSQELGVPVTLEIRALRVAAAPPSEGAPTP